MVEKHKEERSKKEGEEGHIRELRKKQNQQVKKIFKDLQKPQLLLLFLFLFKYLQFLRNLQNNGGFLFRPGIHLPAEIRYTLRSQFDISCGLHIAPKLEWLSFYNCPNLKNPLVEELSSQYLKTIKGERSWWEALEWRKSGPGYLDEIFVPIGILDC